MKIGFCRFVGLVLLAATLAGCGAGLSLDAATSYAATEKRELPGRVYLLRGLIGDIFSLGMDDLAAKIQKHGIKASVHGVSSARFLADDIIAKYRRDPSIAPIMLIGHSTGGDEIITIARRLKTAGIPVALAFGFDPTPIASDVSSNVELFINLYQATNLIGGGRATPGAGFRGRLVNVDLRDRREIVHITLDKSKVIHEQVIEKIVGIAEAAAAKADKSALAAASSAPRNGRAVPAPHEAEPVYVRPLVVKYVVPADARIELWDSAISVTAVEGDTVAAIASRNGVPAWAVAQINSLQADAALPAGKAVLVPHNMYRARPVGTRADAASGTSQASSRRR